MHKFLKFVGISLIVVSLASCSNNTFNGSREYEIYKLAVESGYSGSYEEWLDSIKGEPGRDGIDGREIELSIQEGYICWKYKDENEWHRLQNIKDLKGKDGKDGADGKDGKDGVDGTPGHDGADGKDGTPGRDGADGKDGAPGQDGTDGKDGAPGRDGTDGKNGTNGTNGADGKSAYEIYLEHHPEYTKSEEEWLDDLVNDRLGNRESEYKRVDSAVYSNSSVTKKDALLATYFKEGSLIPYTGINSFFNTFTGLFNMNNAITLFDDKNETLSYKLSHNSIDYSLVIDWKNDVITISDIDFFQVLSDTIDSNYFSRMVEQISYTKTEGHEITYSLGDYDIDLIRVNDDVIVQADIISSVFLTPYLSSMSYNGQFYTYSSGYLGDEDAKLRHESTYNGTTCPTDYRYASNMGLIFALDNVYGLKEYTKVASYYDLIMDNYYLALDLFSNASTYYNEGLSTLFMDTLNDLHTGIKYTSYFNDRDKFEFELTKDFFGPRAQAYFKLSDELNNKYMATFGDYNELRIEGSTAFIRFDEFRYGSYSDIYNPDGTQKPEAKDFDTFYFLKAQLDSLREYNKTNSNKVTNVVFDISNNGGGAVATLFQIFGLLTDNDLQIGGSNYLGDEDYIRNLRIDADNDGDYTDLEAYTEFNYVALVSELSFSCGNWFPTIFKDLNIGRVIGKTTGGGECMVGTLELLDGSYAQISGADIVRSVQKDSNTGRLKSVENGVTPDYEVEYDKFYDLKYLDSFINNGYKEVLA